MGCTLTPLRGYGLIVLFCRVVEILVLTHTESAVPPRTKFLVSLPGYLSDLFKTHSGTPIYLRKDDDSTRIVGGEPKALPRYLRHSLQSGKDGYLHTEALDGVKSFCSVATLAGGAIVFRHRLWPGEIPLPQAWLEFDVDSVEQATAELESRGHRMLIKAKKEPWGQTVSRFIGPEGFLIGITFTAWMREKK
jgi:hypothetical protein